MSAASFSAEPRRVTRWIILGVAAALFVIPILAMIEFSLRAGQTGGYDFSHYAAIFTAGRAGTYDVLFQGITNSIGICVVTVLIVLVLLLPTMILVELKYPRLRSVLEFICIIPITIPSIVLVVGFIPVYSVVARMFGSNPWTLSFAVGIIVLPYAYRPIAANIAAIEIVTLTEAARSLGAGWGQVLGRVILPNLRSGILSSCFITIAVVLGEYTIASFLSQNTFQTALVLVQHTDPYVAVIFAVFALVFAFVLLLIIGRLGSLGRNRRSA
ncbi:MULTISPECIES: ABC transporter permease [Subtercola]|uniref:ABC transporter permease subunit n=1 Tax=Subtercola vilae TaxID=2056433 RepID=A0A4V4RDW5_9MICO|nr:MULTISPECIES: ABC transporter permease subunit [Subtercola]MEA9986632.1 ABC transporter permease subunit [Subtercola sp. RTI3]TIH31514.1 ABC transporter permease subunit [Subtercola vilae]